MTRTVRKTNIHVVIEPTQEFIFRMSTLESAERHSLRESHRILEEVRRHVDDLGTVSLAYELETYCSTHEWTVDSEGDALDRWPACCRNDQADFYGEHKDESDTWFTRHGLDDPTYMQEFRDGMHQRVDETGE